MDALTDYSLVELLLALLPGFLTAEIIAALVVREDRTPFDRVIQALIYTFLTHVLWSWLPWSKDSSATADLAGLAVVAVLLGLLLTFLINTGVLHSLLRAIRITQAASRPNEWYDTFYKKQDHVILHLHDGRRLFGWPRIYPARPERGHILLEGAEWLDRPRGAPRIRLADFLIDVKDVRFVEFLSPLNEE